MLSKAALNRNKGSFILFQKPITDLPPSVVMTKTMTIQLHKLFERAATPLDLESGLLMRGAELNYWRGETGSVVEQEFDGRYGLLYSYEMKLAAKSRIALTVDGADIHGLYVMEAVSAFTLYDKHGSPLCSIAPSRGRYIYLPPGGYQLEVPAGHSLLFGFYFDTKIFRQGSERPFEFMHALIEAKHKIVDRFVFSPDFAIASRIKPQIEHLCEKLTKGKVENELFIADHILTLINIAKDKLLLETAEGHNKKHIAKYVHKAVKEAFATHKHAFTIVEIIRPMKYSREYYNRLHKIYYGNTLQAYKTKLTLKFAKKLLRLGESPTSCAYICEFDNANNFSRFFKKHTGSNPSTYRNKKR